MESYEMDYEKLLERMRRVEALYARTDVAGERAAAGHALEAILEQLKRYRESDPPVEYKFSLSDIWSRRLFLALARRYELQPYRYPGQRRSTIMLRISRSFVDKTLWPEYKELSALLQTHLNEVTEQIIAQALHTSGSDETVTETAGNVASSAPSSNDDSAADSQ